MPGSAAEEKLLLSAQMREGLKMTHENTLNCVECYMMCTCIFLYLMQYYIAFTELVPMLLALPGVKCLLSESYSQDPL